MVSRWADESFDFEPVAEMEPFFVLVALELGDPDAHPRWLEDNARAFHELYRKHYGPPREPQASTKALIHYIVWYQREYARLFSGKT